MSALPNYIVANWKMHGARAEAEAFCGHVVDYYAMARPEAVTVWCPPATLLAPMAERMRVLGEVKGAHGCRLGGQDCSAETRGAYTGDVSAAMLRDAGCEFVILGHSERRNYHGETDALIRRKAQAAMAAGLMPIICVGETLEERARGATLDVLRAQVAQAVPGHAGGPLLLAYEPVWAIGGGKTPDMDDLEMAHGAILAFLAQRKGVEDGRAAVLYGGSVTPDNAKEILAVPGVGGLLVGGASLDADRFCAIVASA